jgi:plastocyanin
VRRHRALLVGLSALAVAAAACGGGDGGSDSGYKEPSGPAQETVTVEAGNLYFKPTELELPAGVNAIKLVGAGGTHDLVFDDDKVPGFQLDVNGEGTSEELKLDLKPGTYTYYCSIPGHRASMEGTLTVR